MFFSVVTKNLNWGILTKNLVTFKRWDEVNDEKSDYYEGSLKNPIFKGGWSLTENQYIEGNCHKRGLGHFTDLKGAWRKRVGGVFEEC